MRQEGHGPIGHVTTMKQRHDKAGNVDHPVNRRAGIHRWRIVTGAALTRLRIGRSAPVIALTAFGFIASCTSAPRERESAFKADPSLTPTAQLELLAQAEQSQPSQVREVPPPPGVEPGALTPAGDDKAWLPLDEALAHLVTDDQPPAPKPRGAIDPVAENAALRHYIKGREAALEDRHIVAITEFNRALELDNDASEILRALARSYKAIGNQSRTADAYQRLLALEPNDGEAQLAAALAALHRGDFTKAAGIIAARRVAGDRYTHDQGAELIADLTLATCLRHLGYDRAGIETAMQLIQPQLESIEHTHYGNELRSAYRNQSELWSWVGDAHCRLGEYEQALEAYRMAMGFVSPDSSSLLARVIYAELHLGHIHAAQLQLLKALQARSEGITERDIRLCAYLYEHAQPVDSLAHSVAEMYQQQPGNSDLARAAALLLPPAESVQLLREFIDRQPRDLDAVGLLVNWLAGDGHPERLDAAVALTATLIQQHPDLAGEYIGRLFFASGRPHELISAVRTHAAEHSPSPALANIEIRTHGLLGAVGEAWALMQQAQLRWPDDTALFALKLDLAVMLEEPVLVRQTLDQAGDRSDITTLLALARTNRAIGDANAAMHFAELAVQSANHAEVPRDLLRRSLIEHAHACIAFARQQPDEQHAQQWAREAEAIALRALKVEHDADDVHEFLLHLFGPNGPLQDTEAFRLAARRLLTTNPESRLYRRLAAEEAISHSRFEQALEQLIDLYESHPADTRALRLAMTAFVRQNREDDALQWLNQNLQDRPGDPALREAWVELMMLQGRSEEAVSSLEDAIAQQRNDYIARQLLEKLYRSTGRPDKAFRLGEQRLLPRPQGVRRETELAAIYAGAGKHHEAIAQIRWVLQHVDDAEYDHLATLIAVLGRMDRDAKLFDQLTIDLVSHTIEHYPHAPLQVYGAAMRSMGRLEQLGEAFDELVEQAAAFAQGAAGPTTQHALVWRDLAQALIDEGQHAAAARALHLRVLADVPTQPEARNGLATFAVIADAGVEDSHAALTLHMVQELAARDMLPRLSGMNEPPTIAAVLFHASQLFGMLGNNQGAEALLREVVAHDPQHMTALNNLGYMRIDAGYDDPQSIEWVERAYELCSEDDGHVFDTVGWLRYKQGVFDGQDGALAYIQRAIAVSANPDEPGPELLDHLGDVQWRLGLHEQAIQSWQQAAQQLDNPQHRREIEQGYMLIQTRGWGLLVAEPSELYNRTLGRQLESLKHKLKAVQSGQTPPIAGTFEESGHQGIEASPEHQEADDRFLDAASN